MTELTERELMLRYTAHDGEGVRSILASRGVIPDYYGDIYNDFAEHLLVSQLGARRVFPTRLPMSASYQAAVMLGTNFERWSVRGQRPGVRTGGVGLAPRLFKDDARQRFHGLVVVVFDEQMGVAGAWTLPWSVIDRHRTPTVKTKLVLPGAWQTDPEATPLTLTL